MSLVTHVEMIESIVYIVCKRSNSEIITSWCHMNPYRGKYFDVRGNITLATKYPMDVGSTTTPGI